MDVTLGFWVIISMQVSVFESKILKKVFQIFYFDIILCV